MTIFYFYLDKFLAICAQYCSTLEFQEPTDMEARHTNRHHLTKLSNTLKFEIFLCFIFQKQLFDQKRIDNKSVNTFSRQILIQPKNDPIISVFLVNVHEVCSTVLKIKHNGDFLEKILSVKM